MPLKTGGFWTESDRMKSPVVCPFCHSVQNLLSIIHNEFLTNVSKSINHTQRVE